MKEKYICDLLRVGTINLFTEETGEGNDRSNQNIEISIYLLAESIELDYAKQKSPYQLAYGTKSLPGAGEHMMLTAITKSMYDWFVVFHHNCLLELM